VLAKNRTQRKRQKYRHVLWMRPRREKKGTAGLDARAPPGVARAPTARGARRAQRRQWGGGGARIAQRKEGATRKYCCKSEQLLACLAASPPRPKRPTPPLPEPRRARRPRLSPARGRNFGVAGANATGGDRGARAAKKKGRGEGKKKRRCEGEQKNHDPDRPPLRKRKRHKLATYLLSLGCHTIMDLADAGLAAARAVTPAADFMQRAIFA
jgi:hypothetical protein